MTEEEKQRLIAEGKLDENGNPIEPENNGGEPDKLPEGDKGEKLLTQAQVDAIISDRLKREREKREAEAEKERLEAERKRLEENNEFKGLAEQYKQELDKLKEDARKATKTSLLLKAGYNEEQVERYAKFVEGETEDEMKAAVEQLKQDVPPKGTYVDPAGAGNNQRQTPKPKDKEDKGRTLYQRLKSQGRTGR